MTILNDGKMSEWISGFRGSLVAYVLPGHQMMLNTDLCLAFSNDNKGKVDLLPGLNAKGSASDSHLKSCFLEGYVHGETDWWRLGEPLHLESSLMVESFLCHQFFFLQGNNLQCWTLVSCKLEFHTWPKQSGWHWIVLLVRWCYRGTTIYIYNIHTHI